MGVLHLTLSFAVTLALALALLLALALCENIGGVCEKRVCLVYKTVLGLIRGGCAVDRGLCEVA
jgi:hypothetical protein